jgi:hypothetical protein
LAAYEEAAKKEEDPVRYLTLILEPYQEMTHKRTGCNINGFSVIL